MKLSVLYRHRNVSLLLLRIALAGPFLFHGYAKWTNFATMPGIMKILAVAEPLGAVALILGFLTRWASLGLAIIMLGAIWTKMSVMGVGYAEMGKTGWEFDFILFAASIAILVHGPGKYSVDLGVGWDERH